MTTHDKFRLLQRTLEKAVLGQADLIESLLIALLADGHLLVEGVPGLAKTRAIRMLAALIEAEFHRIQFTPDLLPADLTGCEIYHAQDGSFRFEHGPLFHHLLLADEINRAPAKVQSALLEAMGERQITVGQTTYPLPGLFLVMATQNPLEHEGTYPLPEAQLDRFLLQVRVDYPSVEVERQILQLARAEARASLDGTTPSVEIESLRLEEIAAARREALATYLSADLEEYLVRLVAATRRPDAWREDYAGMLSFGASPRASIALDRCARVRAWLRGRDYVSPEDIQALAPGVLRHRIQTSWEAQSAGLNADEIIAGLVERVPVP